MPSVWRKTGGSWVKIKTVYRKTGGSWQSIKRIWRKTANAWQLVFLQSLTPSIETKVEITLAIANSTTQTKKITGKLYHWNNADGYTYQFAKGSGNTTPSTYTNISGASGTSTNPASGSSNTLDAYTLTQSDLVPNATNWFIYVSKATNSTYGTEQTSASDPVTFEMPRDIFDLTVGTITPTSISLSWSLTTGSNSYGIYYGTSSSPTTLFGTTTSNSITVTGLSAGTTYYFRVLPWTGSSGNGYYGNYSNEVNSPTESVYTFAFGNNLYIGTNGYIGLDAGSTSDSILSTGTGRFIGILPGDLYQTDSTSIWYWSDGTDYIVRWEGYHYQQPANTRIYQARFTSGASYVSIYALTVSTTTEGTQAFVKDNTTKTSYPSALTTGSEYRVYFDGTTSPVVIVSETEKPKSAMLQVAGLTLGNLDQGYTTLTTATNQQNLPGSVSITPQNFGNGYLYIFYTTGANINQLYVQVSRYDYINTLSFQSITPTYYNVSSNSRGYVVVDLSTKSNYNNAVPWSITVTPYNAGNAGTAVSSSITMSGTNYPAATVGTVSAGNGTLSATVSLSGAANYYTLQVTPSGGSTTTYNQQTGNINLSGLSNGVSYTLYVIPKYYYYYDSVDSNSYTYSGTGVSRTGTPAAPTYTITYFGNGNTGGSTSATSGTLPLTVASNGFTKTGSTFSGWNTASNGTGTSYSVGVSYNTAANLSLYAQWTLDTYTISYDANGGSGAPSSQTKTYGVALTLSSTTPTRTGYTFSGWNTASGGGGTSYAAGGSYTADASATLYAQWTQNYTGPSAPTSLSVTAGTVTGSLSTTLTRNSNTNKTQAWTTSTSQGATISWTKGTGNGTITSDVKWNQTGTTPTSSDTGTWTGVTGSSQVDNGNSGGTTNYYWVRTVDGSGNKSAWVSAGSYTATSPSMTGFTIRLYRGNGSAFSNPTTAPSSTSTSGSYIWSGLVDRGNPATGGEGHYAWANGTLNGTVKTATSTTV